MLLPFLENIEDNYEPALNYNQYRFSNMKILCFILLLSIKSFKNVAFNVKLLRSCNYYNDVLHMIDRF